MSDFRWIPFARDATDEKKTRSILRRGDRMRTRFRIHTHYAYENQLTGIHFTPLLHLWPMAADRKVIFRPSRILLICAEIHVNSSIVRGKRLQWTANRHKNRRRRRKKNVFSIFVCFGPLTRWHPPAISMKPDDIAGCLWLRDASRFCLTAATNSMNNRSPQWVFCWCFRIAFGAWKPMRVAPKHHRKKIDEPNWMEWNWMEWTKKGHDEKKPLRWTATTMRWRRRQRTQLLKNSLILLVGATVEKDPFHLQLPSCFSQPCTLNGHNFNTFSFDDEGHTTSTSRRTRIGALFIRRGGRAIHVKFVTAQWRRWFFLLLTLIPIVFGMHISVFGHCGLNRIVSFDENQLLRFSPFISLSLSISLVFIFIFFVVSLEYRIANVDDASKKERQRAVPFVPIVYELQPRLCTTTTMTEKKAHNTPKPSEFERTDLRFRFEWFWLHCRLQWNPFTPADSGVPFFTWSGIHGRERIRLWETQIVFDARTRNEKYTMQCIRIWWQNERRWRRQREKIHAKGKTNERKQRWKAFGTRNKWRRRRQRSAINLTIAFVRSQPYICCKAAHLATRVIHLRFSVSPRQRGRAGEKKVPTANITAFLFGKKKNKTTATQPNSSAENLRSSSNNTMRTLLRTMVRHYHDSASFEETL